MNKNKIIIKTLLIVFIALFGLSTITMQTYAMEDNNLLPENTIVNDEENTLENNINQEITNLQNEPESVDAESNQIAESSENNNEIQREVNELKSEQTNNLETDSTNTDTSENENVSVNKAKSTPTSSGGSNDLTDFITGATINTTKDANGAYQVQAGTLYDFIIYFEETPGHQFSNNGTLYYVLPEGFEDEFINASGTFTIRVTTADGVVEVENNHYSINGRDLTITWSEEETVHKLFAANNAKFHIMFEASLEKDLVELEFNDAVILPLVYPPVQSKLEMSKTSSSSVNPNLAYTDSTINYSININSTGINSNINLEDSITGNGISLSASNFEVISNKPLEYTLEIDEATNSFVFKTDRLVDGQTVTINYFAKLDESLAIKTDDEKFLIIANNEANLYSKEHDKITKKTNDTIEIKPSISKVGKIIENNQILWVVNINANNKLLIKDMIVTDSINPDSINYMDYVGDGITINVYDANGNLIRENERISWSDLTAHSDGSWSYTIPSSDNYYRYEIQYTTSYPDKVSTVLGNDVHFGNNKTSAGVYVSGDHSAIEKVATDVDTDNMNVTWEITIHVPTSGLDETNYILTEYYPHAYLTNGSVYEKIVGDIQVEGLTGEESYTFAPGDTNAKIYFYKDANKTIPGLNGASAQRDIVITLKTEINPEWLEMSDTDSYLIRHTNHIELGDKTVDTFANVTTPRIIKANDPKDNFTVTIDGKEYPVYKYSVKLGLIDDDNYELNDTFDTNIFKIYTPDDIADYLILLGGDTVDSQYHVPNDSWSNVQKINYIQTATGLKFIITSDRVAKKSDGSLYPYYSFYYYLIPKDITALRSLMQKAAENNGVYTFDNTISYENELVATAESIYYYSALDKKIVGYDEKEKIVYYEIEVNPDEIVLNNGETITLVDTYENMSVIYDSIVVTPSEGVTYDASNSTLTFQLPDAKKVTITYEARLIYNVDNVDDFNPITTVNYHNRATLITGTATFVKDVEGQEEINSSGSGTASLYRINLIKYEAGNMSKRLAGAVFELLDANKNNILDKDGNKVVFTSDANGKVFVEGDEDLDGWSLVTNVRYYLREVKAPNGYKLANFDYSFMISSNGGTNYDEYIYHDNDTMTAKNYPGTDVIVEKLWEDGNENHNSENESVTVKLQEKIGDNDWKDSDVNPIELSASNNWKGIFAGLPLVVTVQTGDDYEDVHVQYRVIETQVNGVDIEEGSYELIDNGDNTFTIVNFVEELTEVTVKKVWNDDDDHDGFRPDSLTVRLSNGQEVTLNEENQWSATIENLDKYADGEEIEYTWEEDASGLPEGYTLTGNDKEGQVTTLTNSYKPEEKEISITKVDIDTGEELEGAKLQVLDSEGKIVDEWVSTKETHVIKGLAANKEYTLKEVVAPDGYLIASDIKFVIDSEGKVTTNGKTATDDEGNIVILVEDAKTKIVVTKVDITTGEELPGAKIQIIDSEGNVVEEWISTKEGHVIEGLKVNEEYTLREVVAPEGYEVTSDTTFIINEDGTVTTTGKITTDAEGKAVLLVQDTKSPTKVPEEKPSKNPGTADYFDLYLILLSLFISGFGSSLLYLRKLNNAE